MPWKKLWGWQAFLCLCSPLYDAIFLNYLCKYLLVREQSQGLQWAPSLDWKGFLNITVLSSLLPHPSLAETKLGLPLIHSFYDLGLATSPL